MNCHGFHAVLSTLAAMRRHVEQLCPNNDIICHPWLKRSSSSFAISLIDCERYDIAREIIGTPIGSTINCAMYCKESDITSGGISVVRVPSSRKPGHGIRTRVMERHAANSLAERERRGRSIYTEAAGRTPALPRPIAPTGLTI